MNTLFTLFENHGRFYSEGKSMPSWTNEMSDEWHAVYEVKPSESPGIIELSVAQHNPHGGDQDNCAWYKLANSGSWSDLLTALQCGAKEINICTSGGRFKTSSTPSGDPGMVYPAGTELVVVLPTKDSERQALEEFLRQQLA